MRREPESHDDEAYDELTAWDRMVTGDDWMPPEAFKPVLDSLALICACFVVMALCVVAFVLLLIFS